MTLFNRKYIIGSLAVLLLFCTSVYSQTAPRGEDVKTISLFSLSNAKSASSQYFKPENEGVILKLDKQKYNSFMQAAPDFFTLTIPKLGREEGSVQIRLLKNQITSDDAKAVTNNGKVLFRLKDRGHHFTGTVVGKNTLVAFSFFNEGVYGFISGDMGNYNLTQLQNQGAGTYALYKEEASEEEFDCGTEIDERSITNYVPAGSSSNNIQTARHPIYISLESNYDVFVNPNVGNSDLAQMTNIMLSHFNIYAQVFKNEEVTIRLSEVKIETTGPTLFFGPGMTNTGGNCPPNGTTNYMSQFQTHRASFYNGDYAYLYVATSCRAAGRAAGTGNFCNNSDASRMGVGLVPSALPVGYELPAIHHRITIFIHEMGHLLGTRHTRECRWNGNGTALDAGPDGTANNCYFGPDPAFYSIMASGGGANDWAEWNLRRGFGVQPGQEIRDEIADNISCFNENIFCNANRYIFHRIADEFPVDYVAYYEALNIWADNTITLNAEATYVAEEYIELLPGFNVSFGAEFEAIIVEDCLGNQTGSGFAEQVPEEKKFAVAVVPNPSDGNFEVLLPGLRSEVSYAFFDFNGILILQGDQSEVEKFSVSQSQLTPGIYFLKIRTGDETAMTKVVIR